MVVERARAQEAEDRQAAGLRAFHSPARSVCGRPLFASHLEGRQLAAFTGPRYLHRHRRSSCARLKTYRSYSVSKLLRPCCLLKAASVAEAQKLDLWLEIGPGQMSSAVFLPHSLPPPTYLRPRSYRLMPAALPFAVC